jgi:nitroreductase
MNFQEIPVSELLQKLQWRYAAKKMNPERAVPQEKVERILEVARLAGQSQKSAPPP